MQPLISSLEEHPVKHFPSRVIVEGFCDCDDVREDFDEDDEDDDDDDDDCDCVFCREDRGEEEDEDDFNDICDDPDCDICN